MPGFNLKSFFMKTKNNLKKPIEKMENGTDPKSEKKAEKKSPKKSAKKQIEELKAQIAEIKEKHLRLFADFDNYKKRTAKEKIELIGSASKDLMRDLLPVVDDFDRAMKSLEETKEVEKVKEGMTIINHKLRGILEQKGLKEMKAIGEDFDSEIHEAITEIPAPDKKTKGKVLDEIEKGYRLNEKIIRFPKVVVGK